MGNFGEFLGRRIGAGLMGGITSMATIKVFWKGGSDRQMQKRLQKAKIRSLRQIAVILRSEAKRLVGRRLSRSRHGQPGTYPRSWTGNYKRSIEYEVGKTRAWIGPSRPLGSHANLLKYGTKRMQPRLVPAEGALTRSKGKLVRKFINLL